MLIRMVLSSSYAQSPCSPTKEVYNPQDRLPSRDLAGSGSRPLTNIPHCCLPQESGPCLSTSVGDLPLRTPRHRRLGGPLPRQLANVTHAHPQASHLVIKRCLLITTSGVNPPFGGLSRSCGKVAYALLTRAPVVSGASSLLPLDLHVLGLSLAFILSQDQTLRCIKSFLLFFSLAQTLPSFISKWN